MAQLKLQTLLLVLLMTFASASPLAQHNSSELMVNKRWYSVPLEEDAPVGFPVPWPSNGIGSRPIRYCFGDDESYEALHKDLMGGIAKWVRATRYSSLVFVPDPACGVAPHGRCICNVAGVRIGALHIFSSSQDTQGATSGYSRASEEHSHFNPPNNLRFPPRKKPAPPGDKSDCEEKERAILMAHELGMTRTAFLASSERPLTSS